MTTVAQAIGERLAAHGVERVFGFPGGGSNLDLIEALDAAGIEFVLTHTEVSAALMAAATAELTGVPGVVVVGNGPGLASVVNGVAHAYLDRVPLIVISDRYTDAERAATDHQILDQQALLAPVVKWSATLDRDAASTLERALHRGSRGAGRSGAPRHAADARRRARPRAHLPSPSPARAPDDLEPLRTALEQARRPVIVAGVEAARVLLPGAIERLADRLGAPVLTTYKAKGVIAEDHARWAGILTGGELERPLLDASDAVLAIGLDPVELLTKPWPYAAPLLTLRACDAGIGYGDPVVACIDPTLNLDALVVAPRETALDAGPVREAALEALRVPSDTLTVWRTVELLGEELPANTTLAVDAGAHMFAATWFWRASEPRRFLISNGLATMGFAVPAALAAACQHGFAVALTGDGGMAYDAFELETAARLGLKLIVVVLNDASLSLIRIKHEAKGHDRGRLDFGPVRFDALAAALGVTGVAVSEEDELRNAVRAAVERDGPTVIDVRLSGAEHARTLQVIRG